MLWYMLCFYGDLEQFIIILLFYDAYGVQDSFFLFVTYFIIPDPVLFYCIYCSIIQL